MKKILREFRTILLIFVVASTVVAANPAAAKDKDTSTGRLLTGKVLDKQDNPLTDAVVYLSNKRTQAVKTYIVGPDGSYHFPELTPSVDYEVYAVYKGQKSDTRGVSQFDDRKQMNIVLRIDLK
jgi:Carboxypeptidase regulatory-like domain